MVNLLLSRGVCLLSLGIFLSSSVADSALPRAPLPAPMPQVLVIKSAEAGIYDQAVKGLMEGLEKNGYRLGKSVEAHQVSLPADKKNEERFLANLLQKKPDLIVVIGTDAAVKIRASLNQNNLKQVPVVFTMVLDPVALQLVQSLNRSGGQFAGVSLIIPPARQFQLIRDVLPEAKSIGVIFNQEEPIFQRLVTSAQNDCQRFGFELRALPLSPQQDIASALATWSEPPDAIWLIPDKLTVDQEPFKQIMSFADQKKVPVIAFAELFVRQGALAALATDFYDQGATAAEMVSAILRGDRPEEMPVRAPRNYKLTFNLSKAKQLNLTIPDTLINLADTLIEK